MKDPKGHKLRVALQTINHKPITYFCKKCKEEYYVCKDGQLFTRKQFYEQKRRENAHY
jgi:hypothetical protein